MLKTKEKSGFRPFPVTLTRRTDREMPMEGLPTQSEETLSRRLYEIMEELDDNPPGPDWDQLPLKTQDWYRECVRRLLAGQIGPSAATV